MGPDEYDAKEVLETRVQTVPWSVDPVVRVQGADVGAHVGTPQPCNTRLCPGTPPSSHPDGLSGVRREKGQGYNVLPYLCPVSPSMPHIAGGHAAKSG